MIRKSINNSRARYTVFSPSCHRSSQTLSTLCLSKNDRVLGYRVPGQGIPPSAYAISVCVTDFSLWFTLASTVCLGERDPLSTRIFLFPAMSGQRELTLDHKLRAIVYLGLRSPARVRIRSAEDNPSPAIQTSSVCSDKRVNEYWVSDQVEARLP